jgi:hypothetical protein
VSHLAHPVSTPHSPIYKKQACALRPLARASSVACLCVHLAHPVSTPVHPSSALSHTDSAMSRPRSLPGHEVWTHAFPNDVSPIVGPGCSSHSNACCPDAIQYRVFPTFDLCLPNLCGGNTSHIYILSSQPLWGQYFT